MEITFQSKVRRICKFCIDRFSFILLVIHENKSLISKKVGGGGGGMAPTAPPVAGGHGIVSLWSKDEKLNENSLYQLEVYNLLQQNRKHKNSV